MTVLSRARRGLSRRQLLQAVGAAVLGLAPLRPRRALADAEATALVTMSNRLKFDPPSVTVKVGLSVKWRNDSALVHTVTADPEKAARFKDVALPEGAEPFNSGDLEPEATFQHVFTVPGRYRYFCIPHEAAGMVGEVVVTD